MRLAAIVLFPLLLLAGCNPDIKVPAEVRKLVPTAPEVVKADEYEAIRAEYAAKVQEKAEKIKAEADAKVEQAKATEQASQRADARKVTQARSSFTRSVQALQYELDDTLADVANNAESRSMATELAIAKAVRDSETVIKGTLETSKRALTQFDAAKEKADAQIETFKTWASAGLGTISTALTGTPYAGPGMLLAAIAAGALGISKPKDKARVETAQNTIASFASAMKELVPEDQTKFRAALDKFLTPDEKVLLTQVKAKEGVA